jgi:hypothetical protein
MYNREPWFNETDWDATTDKPRELVFVHVKKNTNDDWDVNVPRHFTRLPAVGEIFQLTHDSPVFKVALVCHCPFKAEFGAEVFALETDLSAEICAIDSRLT